MAREHKPRPDIEIHPTNPRIRIDNRTGRWHTVNHFEPPPPPKVRSDVRDFLEGPQQRAEPVWIGVDRGAEENPVIHFDKHGQPAFLVDGVITPILGSLPSKNEITAKAMEHLRAGDPVVLNKDGNGGDVTVALASGVALWAIPGSLLDAVNQLLSTNVSVSKPFHMDVKWRMWATMVDGKLVPMGGCC